MFAQADHLIEKYGAKEIADLIGMSVDRVRRWRHLETRGGTGGVVPSRALTKMKMLGLDLTPADLAPEENDPSLLADIESFLAHSVEFDERRFENRVRRPSLIAHLREGGVISALAEEKIRAFMERESSQASRKHPDHTGAD